MDKTRAMKMMVIKIETGRRPESIEISLDLIEQPGDHVLRFLISVHGRPCDIELTSVEAQELMKTLALFVRQYFGKFIS